MGDLTENNLHAIAMPTSIITLSVAPSVFSTLMESDEILNNGTYYGGICFERLSKYIKSSLDL